MLKKKGNQNPTKMEKISEEQEKAMKIQVLGRQAQEMERQLGEIDKRIDELNIIQESLEELKGNKDAEMLVPFGSGVLLKAKLVDDQNVLVNIGSDVITKKTITQANKTLKEQVESIDQVRKKLEKDLAALKQEISKQL